MELKIRAISDFNMADFLAKNEYSTEELSDSVMKISKSGEMPIFMTAREKNIFFRIDLGNISEIGNKELYFKLLDLNTDILPVSVGFDTTEKDDPRLVLVESREIKNLDDNELLEVLNAMEEASDRIEMLVSEFLK